jgi:hypothetical protein
MKIRILINRSRARSWHILLADRLMGLGHEVAFAFVEGGASLNPLIALLIGFENIAYRKSQDCATKRIKFDFFAGLTGDMPEPDVIINLTNSAYKHSVLTLRLLFDGAADEGAAISAILHGCAPHLSVVTGDGELVFEGLPAIERNQLLSAAFGFVLTRSITMLARAIVSIQTQQPLSAPIPIPLQEQSYMPVHVSTSRLLSFGANVFFNKIRAKIRRILNRVEHENQDHWRIALRKIPNDAERVVNTQTWPQIEWSILSDDNQRFYADPFIFVHNGTTYMFCEEFPYATLKGVISVSIIGADGSMSKPKHVLERPFHLSYPFVFERDGEIWMIPETYSSGKIELYRAAHFPDKWVFEQVLVDDVVASDATLFERDGLLWLFACVHDGGSSWDTLSLWYAKTLKGPWQAHKLNPVLVDAGAARPAGNIVVKDGRIIRPAQNCVGGYGVGLVLKEITQLDVHGFAEHVIADLPPPAQWSMVGVHTLNDGAGFEVIDQLHDRARPC